MVKMIPGEALIYERSNGVVYARYRDPPHNTIPRWIVGGDPDSVNKAQGSLIGYDEWKHIHVLADENPALKKQLDRLIILYYTIKDSATGGKENAK
jgi:hypothetical protein|tara:strand:- start:1179 stop:1466 length:288 start_codon:yes stop_codon:yes gene_type:complete